MRGEAVIEAQACPASGARGIIIDTLEVMEPDFAATLTEEKNQEADEAAEHEKITRENKVTKTLKELDVKYEILDLKSMDNFEGEYKYGMRFLEEDRLDHVPGHPCFRYLRRGGDEVR